MGRRLYCDICKRQITMETAPYHILTYDLERPNNGFEYFICNVCDTDFRLALRKLKETNRLIV